MKTVTICGSMRFESQMREIAFLLEAGKGYNVLQCTYNDCGRELDDAMLQNLANAHFQKIRLSDAIYVVDIGGYIGDSVRSEIEYAKGLGKKILLHSQFEKKQGTP